MTLAATTARRWVIPSPRATSSRVPSSVKTAHVAVRIQSRRFRAMELEDRSGGCYQPGWVQPPVCRGPDLLRGDNAHQDRRNIPRPRRPPGRAVSVPIFGNVPWPPVKPATSNTRLVVHGIESRSSSGASCLPRRRARSSSSQRMCRLARGRYPRIALMSPQSPNSAILSAANERCARQPRIVVVKQIATQRFEAIYRAAQQ